MSGLMDMMESGSADGDLGELDNLTLTCAARYIQDPIPFFSAAAIVVRALQALVFLLLIVAGVFLNCLVIVLVAKYKKLQTLSFLVSLQVNVMDLLLSATLLTSLVTAIANRWLLGEYVCAITGLLLSVTRLTRAFLMCAFVIDRFLAVFMPYFYPKHKLKVTVSLSIASWVFAIPLAVAMLPGLLDCYRFHLGAKVCSISSSCSYACSIYVRLFITIVSPATILPVIFYAILYRKGKKIRQAMNSDPASGEVYRREWKATITFFLMFLSLFVITLPPAIVNGVTMALTSGGSSSFAAYIVLTVDSCIMFFLVVADPIVIMRDRDVREILSAAVCRKNMGRPESPPEINASTSNTNDTANTSP